MAGFNTSSIHGQSTLKLEQFYDIVLMRSWHFMVFYTLRFRYFPFSLFSVYVYACASSGQLHCCLLRCAHIFSDGIFTFLFSNCVQICLQQGNLPKLTFVRFLYDTRMLNRTMNQVTKKNNKKYLFFRLASIKGRWHKNMTRREITHK
jgi:hypothetical protein